jgi:hypothetical protein
MARIKARINYPEKFQGTIFSWRNTKGYKVYSNIGFPKDEPYTEGKIEYQ